MKYDRRRRMFDISFRNPSKNSPYLPPFLCFCSWLLFNIFVMFILGSGGWMASLGKGFIFSLLLLIIGLFTLIVLISYLLKKKFREFFLAFGLILVVTFVTSFMDRILVPYKLQRVTGNMANLLESAAKSADHTQSFGNVTPVHVCNPEKLKDGSFQCRACYCPGGLDLEAVDGVAYCLYRGDHGIFTGEKFSAPCSGPRVLANYKREVEDLFANDSTKRFSVYSYRAGKAESCHEYRVWNDWDAKNMVRVCENRSDKKCVIQEGQSCAAGSATQVCTRKNLNTHEAIKMVSYSSSWNTRGFMADECK
jgi:hypothetical protein